jgi:hypothetical protein
VYQKGMGCDRVDWIYLGPGAGSYEHSNEPSDSINCREFIDQLSYYQLLCFMELVLLPGNVMPAAR